MQRYTSWFPIRKAFGLPASEVCRVDTVFDLRTAAALLYLVLPAMIFFAMWFKPIFAVVLFGLTAFATYQALSLCTGTSLRWGGRYWAILFAVATMWTAMGGAGHIFYANAYDWIIRDSVLRDLVMSKAGIPVYGEQGNFSIILRAPIGYFLPAALLGSLFGIQWADLFLWLWTLIGVCLFFALLPLSNSSILRFTAGLFIVVFFSGMDTAGLFLSGQGGGLTDHIEWWAHYFQYSSNSTLLFWTPNHAIPAWIVAALFFRHWRQERFLQMLAPVLATLPLWSPFALIGIAPFLVFPLGGALREKRFDFLRVNWLLPSLGIFLVIFRYITMDASGIPSGTAGMDLSFLSFYILFVVLEFGVLAFILWRLSYSPLVIASVALLLILPLFKFGPSNDLVMRASIPALCILCCELIVIFGHGIKRGKVLKMALVFALLIGAETPLHEMARALTWPHWPASTETDLCKASGGDLPSHYVARLNQTGMMILLKDSVSFGKNGCETRIEK